MACGITSEMGVGKPRLLITRAIFPEVLARLLQHFDVECNQDDAAISAQALPSRLVGKDAALTTADDIIDDRVISQCPTLRICANMAVGYSNFDLAAMAAHEVVATNTPEVLTETTADFGFALMMAAARRIGEAERYLRAGKWKQWRHDLLIGHDIAGSTLGLLGMGRIGRAIARRGAQGFGMQVIYNSLEPLPAHIEAALPASFVDKDTLLANADHLVVVIPYCPANHHAVGAGELARMKPTATLTNVSRGGVVDDVALAAVLSLGMIAAAALDVFEGEPAIHPALLDAPNLVATPHIASASHKTRLAMANLAADNLIAYFSAGAALTPVTLRS